MPLLVATGVVQPPSQAEAVAQVQRQRADADVWVAQLDSRKEALRHRSAWLRAFVAVQLDPDALGELDHYVARVFHARMVEASPELICDFWLRTLRDGAGVLDEGVDVELATALGYSPVEPGLPICSAAWRTMKRDPQAERRALDLLQESDERRIERQGGEQLALGLLGGAR